MIYLDIAKIIDKKIDDYQTHLSFIEINNELILKVKFNKRLNESSDKKLSKILNIINELKIKYQIKKIDLFNINLIFDKNSYIMFQKKIIDNSEKKWLIEIISGTQPYNCNSDISDIEFDIETRYFDNEEDAMVAYYNLKNYNPNYNTRYIVLAPKPVLNINC